MNILYVGDVMGEMGVEVVEKVLLELREKEEVDLVIAQVENVTEGKGITPEDFNRLQAGGVDFGSGGNWSLKQPEIIPLLDDPDEPIIRPANYPKGTPGLGYKYIETPAGNVLVISLVGGLVGRDAGKPIDNPLQVVDKILKDEASTKSAVTIVNFHGDYSSEKVIVGHYLDGRVSAVIGDHWHVPTADPRVLPKGTAHITDVGMCGALNASLGVSLASLIPRWRDGVKTHNIMETTGSRQFNAVLIAVDPKTGLAKSIKQIQRTV